MKAMIKYEEYNDSYRIIQVLVHVKEKIDIQPYIDGNQKLIDKGCINVELKEFITDDGFYVLLTEYSMPVSILTKEEANELEKYKSKEPMNQIERDLYENKLPKVNLNPIEYKD